MAGDRAPLLFSAKISEQAERYQDMVAEMKKIAQMAGEQELSVEERNLLSVGELDGLAGGCRGAQRACLCCTWGLHGGPGAIRAWGARLTPIERTLLLHRLQEPRGRQTCLLAHSAERGAE